MPELWKQVGGFLVCLHYDVWADMPVCPSASSFAYTSRHCLSVCQVACEASLLEYVFACLPRHKDLLHLCRHVDLKPVQVCKNT